MTISFWGLGMALTRLAVRYFSAISLSFMRCFIASCTVAVVAVVTKMEPPKKEDIKLFLAAGAFGFFLYMLGFNKGCETIPAATGSIILATSPVVTAILARVLYKEKLKALQWIATFIEFSGVILITVMRGAFSANKGLLWLFLGIISVSVYNILQRKLTKTYSGMQACAYSIFAGTLMLAIFSPKAIQEVQSAPPIQLLYLLIMGVFSSALAYITWAIAFKKAKIASSVSNYMFITPFITSTLSFFLAGEIPDMPTILGGSIILSGMLLFNFETKIRGLFQHKETAQ